MAIKENIAQINEEKNQAARDAGVCAEQILLCAVTKTRTPDEINEAIDAGVTDIGENKVQEILEKYDQIKPVRWHMIGHLQTNKVKYIIDKVSLIHSVDSAKLAAEIDKRAAQHKLSMDILIQVNSAMEESKFGISAQETGELLSWILENCKHVNVKGLMCIAPFAENPSDVEAYFREVKELYQQYADVKHERLDFQYLSMGMSHDYQTAIKEGSNLIRIGTAIFGARSYNK